MANPDPEIKYELAIEARPDAIVGTGRSDYPNQINNVLGFPFIFRGALDVRSSTINDEMKLAASYALADLTKQPVTRRCWKPTSWITWNLARIMSCRSRLTNGFACGKHRRLPAQPWKAVWPASTLTWISMLIN
jgi:malic enzyme